MSNEVNDPAYAQDAAVRAKADLEQAYKEANEALARGHSVIDESWHDKAVDQLHWLLLIRDRHTAAARFVVVVCYVLVISRVVAMLAPEDAGDPDAVPLWQDALVAAIVTIILRAVAGFIVRGFDARRTRQARPTARDHRSNRRATSPSAPRRLSRADETAPDRAWCHSGAVDGCRRDPAQAVLDSARSFGSGRPDPAGCRGQFAQIAARARRTDSSRRAAIVAASRSGRPSRCRLGNHSPRSIGEVSAATRSQ